jgi:hypothetical protein
VAADPRARSVEVFCPEPCEGTLSFTNVNYRNFVDGVGIPRFAWD